jgi:hypothetical protein
LLRLEDAAGEFTQRIIDLLSINIQNGDGMMYPLLNLAEPLRPDHLQVLEVAQKPRNKENQHKQNAAQHRPEQQ